MERQPIKRSRYLAALSRDHHGGLLFCWKIRQGLALNISGARLESYARYFWEYHLKDHFREEEILLFNQLDDELTLRAKAQHQVLSSWFARIYSAEPLSTGEYLVFVTDLNNHIRFEERQVLPLLEQRLSNETLRGIQDILMKLHLQPFEDNYADEFWVKQKQS